MALGAVRQVRARGLAVPGDVSVIGYDDSLLIGFTDPPLTTVRQSVQAMGAAAVRALLDEIAGMPAPRAEYVFRPELVVRSSTGAAPPAHDVPVGAEVAVDVSGPGVTTSGGLSRGAPGPYPSRHDLRGAEDPQVAVGEVPS